MKTSYKTSIVCFNKKEKLWMVKTGEKVSFQESVILLNVTFIVEPGAQRIIRERVTSEEMTLHNARFPHAYAAGLIPEGEMPKDLIWKQFRYDVMKDDSFILMENYKPVHWASAMHLNDKEMKLVL
jgi:hypothetical protein